MHFATRVMLSSRAPGRFRARIVWEARAYGMNAHMDVWNDYKEIEGLVVLP